ncbi:hypothetical protein JCM3765_003876 [Sporobolomyces pararoseus]
MVFRPSAPSTRHDLSPSRTACQIFTTTRIHRRGTGGSILLSTWRAHDGAADTRGRASNFLLDQIGFPRWFPPPADSRTRSTPTLDRRLSHIKLEGGGGGGGEEGGGTRGGGAVRAGIKHRSRQGLKGISQSKEDLPCHNSYLKQQRPGQFNHTRHPKGKLDLSYTETSGLRGRFVTEQLVLEMAQQPRMKVIGLYPKSQQEFRLHFERLISILPQLTSIDSIQLRQSFRFEAMEALLIPIQTFLDWIPESLKSVYIQGVIFDPHGSDKFDPLPHGDVYVYRKVELGTLILRDCDTTNGRRWCR